MSRDHFQNKGVPGINVFFIFLRIKKIRFLQTMPDASGIDVNIFVNVVIFQALQHSHDNIFSFAGKNRNILIKVKEIS